MATADTLAVTVSNKAFPLIERACETAEFLEKAASRAKSKAAKKRARKARAKK